MAASLLSIVKKVKVRHLAFICPFLKKYLSKKRNLPKFTIDKQNRTVLKSIISKDHKADIIGQHSPPVGTYETTKYTLTKRDKNYTCKFSQAARDMCSTRSKKSLDIIHIVGAGTTKNRM